MHQHSIDINADLGECIGNEKQLMPFITSCNIACGGHAGDESSMRAVVKLAKSHRIKIGAHPSFPDKDNFGRVPLEMPCVALYNTLVNQINSLSKIIREENAILHHVKPHGALYNLAAKDDKIANIIVEVMRGMELPVYLYVPFDSVIAKIAQEHRIPIKYEAFADRNYNDDLSLVSRQEQHAIINDEEDVFQHVLRMISKRKVKTISGNEVNIEAQTICIHGDNPEAVKLAKKLKNNLEEQGILIK